MRDRAECVSRLPLVDMQQTRPVRTIALVGPDGSGKTTQARRLAAELAALGLPAAYCRNAGGRRWFGRLAARLGRADADDLLGRRRMLVVESVLRWLAILRTLVRRALTGELTVMDRYAVCQYASLRARAAAPAAERRARLAYRLFPPPDVTVLLTVDPHTAQHRIDTRGYDHETLDYLTASAAAYRSLPEFGGFVVVNGDGDPDEVAAAIRSALPPVVPEPPHRARIRATILTGGPLLAGVAALGQQLAEAL